MPGSREAAPRLATFSEAILPKDWPLAFLAAPVLEEACVPPPFAWNALKLRSPPVLTTVLRHAQHLSRDAGQSVLASWPAQAMPPEAACGKVLEYLNSQASLHCHFHQHRALSPKLSCQYMHALMSAGAILCNAWKSLAVPV